MMNVLLGFSRTPAWRCALATAAVAPISLLAMLYMATFGRETPNPAAAVVYFVLCLAAAAPLAFANGWFVAPWIAKMSQGKASVVGSHLILTAVWIGLLLLGYLAFRFLGISQVSDEGAGLFSVLLMLWYLTMLLGPAVIAGSFVYSLHAKSMPRV